MKTVKVRILDVYGFVGMDSVVGKIVTAEPVSGNKVRVYGRELIKAGANSRAFSDDHKYTFPYSSYKLIEDLPEVKVGQVWVNNKSSDNYRHVVRIERGIVYYEYISDFTRHWTSSDSHSYPLEKFVEYNTLTNKRTIEVDPFVVDITKEHVHAEVIRAYADGAQIQFKFRDTDNWGDVEVPTFHPSMQYRVKPEEPKLLPAGLYKACLKEPYYSSGIVRVLFDGTVRRHGLVDTYSQDDFDFLSERIDLDLIK